MSEARHTRALLARDADDEALVKVAGDVLTWTHPDRAAEITRSYLLGHPRDREAHRIWTEASSRVQAEIVGRLDADLPAGPGRVGQPSRALLSAG